MDTNVISLRLSREIYQFPVYLNQINSFHQKIIEGSVKSNPQHIYAFTNAMKTYYQTEDTKIIQMIKKSQFLVNTWFQQNTTEINQLENLAQDILKNFSLLAPLVKVIGYQNQLQLPFTNYTRIPYQQIIQGTTQDGVLFANFFNSSLNTIDDPKCYQGKFTYDPRCRFWYMNNLNQTSFLMSYPRISLGMTTPYLSQFGCQKMLFYNTTTKTIQIYKVQCLEAMLSNISSYFENVIKSSKQYYVIDPRTLSILYNSKKQYDYSSLKQTDNFYNVELEYLQNKTSSQELLDIINQNFNQWNFLTQNNYTSMLQMIDLSKKSMIIDYNRNSSHYKVIINPVISYDEIPKHIIKYSQSQGQQLQYAYLQINMISNEDLKAQTNSLIDFSTQFFLIIQIILGVLGLLFLLISSYYAFQITNLIIQPLISLTEDLNHINELNKMVEISEIIQNYDQNADELFLSLETQLLYRSFFELFECLLYTSERFFVNNQGQTLLELSKSVSFFQKFGNNSALGIIHNNIGNILLNQQHYFQALENFSLAVMYAKYEICQFFNDNNINYSFDNLFKFYSLNETSSEKTNKINNQEHQISKISISSLKKKNSSFSETKNGLTVNSYNQKKEESNQNIQGASEASPVQKMITNKIQKSNQNEQGDSKEKQQQFFQLIESLKSRMYNYIITLIAFQENLEINQIDSRSYYFWPEIRILLNDLTKVQSFLPLSQNTQALYLCLISKSCYRLFQSKEAEQKLQDAMQLIKNQKKQNNKLNLENKNNFLSDSIQISTKKPQDNLQQKIQKVKNKFQNQNSIQIEGFAKQLSSQMQQKVKYQYSGKSPLGDKFENINQSFKSSNSSVISINNSKQIANKNQDKSLNQDKKNQSDLTQSLSQKSSFCLQLKMLNCQQNFTERI
ncbi:hypothetical protein ABPG74_003126 [Tetrahymena malaccensis]